jgi:hypothetical protein
MVFLNHLDALAFPSLALAFPTMEFQMSSLSLEFPSMASAFPSSKKQAPERPNRVIMPKITIASHLHPKKPNLLNRAETSFDSLDVLR